MALINRDDFSSCKRTRPLRFSLYSRELSLSLNGWTLERVQFEILHLFPLQMGQMLLRVPEIGERQLKQASKMALLTIHHEYINICKMTHLQLHSQQHYDMAFSTRENTG